MGLITGGRSGFPSTAWSRGTANFVRSKCFISQPRFSVFFFSRHGYYLVICFYTNALYLSALLTSPAGQASAVDTLSNVKIPTIEKSNPTSESDADGWYCVPPEDSTYSLLVGLPIDGTRYNGTYHLCVESLYMVLDCPLVSVSTILSNYTQGCRNPIEGFSLDLKGTSPTLYPNQTSYPAVVPTGANFCASSNLDSDNSFIANCTLTCSSVE